MSDLIPCPGRRRLPRVRPRVRPALPYRVGPRQSDNPRQGAGRDRIALHRFLRQRRLCGHLFDLKGAWRAPIKSDACLLLAPKRTWLFRDVAQTVRRESGTEGR